MLIVVETKRRYRFGKPFKVCQKKKYTGFVGGFLAYVLVFDSALNSDFYEND